MGTIADHKLGAEATRRALAGENAYLKSFLGITVIFTIAHGVFVLLLVFLFRVAGPVTWADARLALEAGYADQSHFSREFRELSGVSPAEYRVLRPASPNHVPFVDTYDGRSRFERAAASTKPKPRSDAD